MLSALNQMRRIGCRWSRRWMVRLPITHQEEATKYNNLPARAVKEALDGSRRRLYTPLRP